MDMVKTLESLVQLPEGMDHPKQWLWRHPSGGFVRVVSTSSGLSSIVGSRFDYFDIDHYAWKDVSGEMYEWLQSRLDPQ